MEFTGFGALPSEQSGSLDSKLGKRKRKTQVIFSKKVSGQWIVSRVEVRILQSTETGKVDNDS